MDTFPLFWASDSSIFGSLEFVATADRKLLCVSIPAPPPSLAPALADKMPRPWWLGDSDDAFNFKSARSRMSGLDDDPVPDPIAMAVAIATEATRVVQLDPAGPRVVGCRAASPGHVDRLWLHLEHYLGPTPSHDDLRHFAFALMNIHGQLLVGEPLHPCRLAENASGSYPYGLRNIAGHFQCLLAGPTIHDLDDPGFVGAIDRPDESFFDLLREGALEDCDTESESSEGSCSPRGYNMVQLAPIPEAGNPGTSAARATTNPAMQNPVNPATGVKEGEALVDVPITDGVGPQPAPRPDGIQDRLKARHIELEETRRQLEHEKEEIDRERDPDAVSISKRDAEFEDVIYPNGDPDAVSISKRDAKLLLPETFVNDTIIDFYIK
ncbi:hypothetical protein PR202_gb10331 [Eleusine coracana subsp. coracana]|uniref:Uncharacterized protein n=1 Tax=Eleusine coracana subsp. coracana TaxID=191504 RepID=A0AAV5EJG0_ELECO|nr:hypothetical protein PR202_gb10331 [Eleusine coracana subsp. coracana]